MRCELLCSLRGPREGWPGWMCILESPWYFRKTHPGREAWGSRWKHISQCPSGQDTSDTCTLPPARHWVRVILHTAL